VSLVNLRGISTAIAAGGVAWCRRGPSPPSSPRARSRPRCTASLPSPVRPCGRRVDRRCSRRRTRRPRVDRMTHDLITAEPH